MVDIFTMKICNVCSGYSLFAGLFKTRVCGHEPKTRGCVMGWSCMFNLERGEPWNFGEDKG